MRRSLVICGIAIVSLFYSGCSPDEEEEEALTLENCEGAAAADVPSFFQKYFACVSITRSGSYTKLKSDGRPPHESWYWKDDHPNYISFVSQGAGYFKNPGQIASQEITISIPNNPQPRGVTITSGLVDGIVGSSSLEYPMGVAGLALDGVALYNPLAGPMDDIWEEIYSFDYYNAHPSPDKMYHYHTVTKGPLEVLEDKGLVTNTTPGSGEIELYGIMCDGTVVMGCTELDGSPVDTTDFDAQSGHVHDLVDESGVTHFSDRYHTHICWAQATNHKLTPEIQFYDECDR